MDTSIDKIITFFNGKVSFVFSRNESEIKNIAAKLSKTSSYIDISSINSAKFYPSSLPTKCSLSFITAGNAAPFDNKHSNRIIDLDELEKKASGAGYIAALKMDADNFGKETMSSGLLKTSVLSSYFKYFFQGYLDKVIEDHFGYTVYSGGDDLFILGPWDQMLTLSRRISSDFQKLTKDRFHLSAGIAIISKAAAIPAMSGLAQDAEYQAKKIKNCVSVFNNVYKWSKIDELKNLINDSLIDEKENSYKDPFGNSLIYDLYQLTKKLEDGDLTAIPKIFYRMRDNAELLTRDKNTNAISLYKCLVCPTFEKDKTSFNFKYFHFIANYCALITRK